MEHPNASHFKACASIHCPLKVFQPIDLSFDSAIAIGPLERHAPADAWQIFYLTPVMTMNLPADRMANSKRALAFLPRRLTIRRLPTRCQPLMSIPGNSVTVQTRVNTKIELPDKTLIEPFRASVHTRRFTPSEEEPFFGGLLGVTSPFRVFGIAEKCSKG